VAGLAQGADVIAERGRAFGLGVFQGDLGDA